MSQTLVEGALSTVPVVGGPMAVMWVALAGRAYDKRRETWEADITTAVNDLLERMDDLDESDLANNDQFLDALAYATSAAITTAHQEKLAALRNAVLNAAAGTNLDTDTQAIFLRHVRDFTPSHLRLLKLLDDPKRWFSQHGIAWPDNIMMGGLGTDVVEVGLPELAGQRVLYDQLHADLSYAGLTNTGGLHTMMSGNGLAARRTSDRGREFLAFITDPRG